MTGSSDLLELSFRDRLDDLLLRAPGRLGRDAEPVLLAESLRQFFVAVPLAVLWAEYSNASEPRVTGAAAERSRRQPARELREEEAKNLWAAASGLAYGTGAQPLLKAAATTGDGRLLLGLRQCLEEPPGAPISELVLLLGPGVDDRNQGRLSWLSRHTSSHRLLFAAHTALRDLSEVFFLAQHLSSPVYGEAMHLDGLVHQVKHLSARIERLADTPATLFQGKLAKELGRSVIRLALGMGWDRDTRLSLDDRRAGLDLAEALNRLWRSQKALQARAVQAGSSTSLRQLEALCRIVEESFGIDRLPERGAPGGEGRAVGGDAPPEAESMSDRERLWLRIDESIAVWSRLLRQALDQTAPQKRATKAYVEQWCRTCVEAMVDVGEILVGTTQPRIGLALLPAWLQLWLCYEIGSRDPGDALLADVNTKTMWEVRRDLAYVARESLRALGHDRRHAFLFQPGRLALAMINLIAFHGRHVLAVPEELKLGELLRRIGEANGTRGLEFSAGHLQHALGLHLASQFILALEVPDPESKGAYTSIAALLARKEELGGFRSEAGEKRLRRAMAIAALLHDVGLLLVPAWPSSDRNPWVGGDCPLDHHLKTIQAALDQQVSDLLEGLQKDEEFSKDYLGSDERAAREWLALSKSRHRPDHCLLGAWFLDRWWKAAQAGEDGERKLAVRAVLYHKIITQKIDATRDPLAALLVFCDELFVWRPRPQTWIPSEALGHTSSSFASFHVAECPRIAQLEFPGLQIDIGAEGAAAGAAKRRLRYRLERVAEAGEASWPLLRFHLHPGLREGEILFEWLSLAQNLERVSAPSGSFGIGLDVMTTRPREVRELDWSLRDLFRASMEDENKLGELGSEVRKWLDSDSERFPDDDPSGLIETLRIRPLGRTLYRRDMEIERQELDRAVQERLGAAFRARLERTSEGPG